MEVSTLADPAVGGDARYWVGWADDLTRQAGMFVALVHRAVHGSRK